MKCRFCDTDIPEDSLVCPKCGNEFLIVPEYNPLEDILTQEMKNHFNENNDAAEPDIYATKLFMNTQKPLTADHDRMKTAVMQRKTERIPVQGTKKTIRRHASKNVRRLRKSKKRRKWPFILLILMFAVVFAAYHIYGVQMKLGTVALHAGKYSEAMGFYKRAEKINSGRTAAYIGMANVFLAEGSNSEAEELLLGAIKNHGDSIELYQATIDYYINCDNLVGVRELFSACEDTAVLDYFEEYLVSEPEFSLEAGKYDSIQELVLSGTGTIYYTTDGSEVSENSTKYIGPIELPEGETLVKAICVNSKGIPSEVITCQYTVELPVENAPRVIPLTGQYSESTYITIQVPDGCTAYYTMNGTTPTEESSKYTRPIQMPKGETEFSAVIINANGKISDVTRRYYELNVE